MGTAAIAAAAMTEAIRNLRNMSRLRSVAPLDKRNTEIGLYSITLWFAGMDRFGAATLCAATGTLTQC